MSEADSYYVEEISETLPPIKVTIFIADNQRTVGKE